MGWNSDSPWRAIAGTGQNVTIGATSTTAATAFGSQTYAIQVAATGNCHIAIANAPTATATAMLLKGTDPPMILKVAPGEKIAVIQDGASTGTLNVVELTH